MSQPKDIVLSPNTADELTRAGRYLLGMRARDAEDGAELLDMFGVDPAKCRSAEPVRVAS
jgi:hypothetical protein